MVDFKKYTLNEMYIGSARDYADKKALSYVSGEGFTYAEVLKAAFDFDCILNSKKLGRGSKIAILAENSPWWGISYIAITIAGRVAVPILPDFHPDNIDNILKHVEADALFVSSRLFNKVKNFKGMKRSFKVFNVEKCISVKLKDKSISFDKSVIEEYKKGLEKYNLDDVLDYFEAKDIKDSDLCSIIYTSGTTGTSKGVMLTHGNLAHNIDSSCAIPMSDKRFSEKTNISLSVLPLSHAYEGTIGFLVTFFMGTSIHYLSRPLSAASLIPAMKKVKPGIMLSVPLLIEKIYKESIAKKFYGKGFVPFLYEFYFLRLFFNRLAGKKLLKTFGGNLFFFGLGGAALSADVERFLREAKFPYSPGYGLTETSPLVAGANASKSRFKSTGHKIKDVEIRIFNPDKKTGEGEIQVKGPSVMKGYYKDEKQTKEVFTEDGWFKTGDLGYLKNDYLYICGRSKNMILGPSGENIYPEAIESMINKFEYVEESIVMQDENKNIVAKIHFNEEELKKVNNGEVEDKHKLEDVSNYMKHIRDEINKRLSSFSRVSDTEHQEEPFEKTATNKIKRYLYTATHLRSSKKEKKSIKK